jgi:probable rRNA maturation factor
VAVVDDAEISRLNDRFRDENRATDVLAFDLRDDANDGALDGEIVVSAETARRTAEADGRDPFAELVLYVVHGCLHLAGHDDIEPDAHRRMHDTENAILTALGYGAVYGEVRP